MGKRHSTLGLALLVAACSGRGPEGPSHRGVRGPPRATHPNILLVTLDQVGTRLGTYGAPARTPSLDRLAARGRRFDRAYGQYPSLTPSRLACFSAAGRDHAPLVRPGIARGPPRAVPLPEAFDAAGYFTARVGPLAGGAGESVVTWDRADDPAPGDPGATARRPWRSWPNARRAPSSSPSASAPRPPSTCLPPSLFRLYDPRSLRLPLEGR